MKFFSIFLLSLFGVTVVNAQNNPVFNGGNGDGWGNTVYLQSFNNIYSGGNGDGWNTLAFSQPGNAIFTGGNGDGWDSTRYAQPWNNIFVGGIGDGWDSTRFAQPGNNIYFGGIGDGWSSTYRPTGPLPVSILAFTAQKRNEVQGVLSWQTSSELNSAWFEVERATDAVNFYPIGRVAAAGNSVNQKNYSLIDNAPLKGYNYYRLKMIDLDGSYTYSPARVLLFDHTPVPVLTCYPNPTTGKFRVSLTGFEKDGPTVININDMKGTVVWQLKWNRALNQSAITIDLSGKAKGLYFIHAVSNGRQASGKVILQ